MTDSDESQPKKKSIKDSDESSEEDSELDLLPDLRTPYQPEDNDSSDYLHESGDNDEFSDDSSVILSRDQRKTPGKKRKRSRKVRDSKSAK